MDLRTCQKIMRLMYALSLAIVFFAVFTTEQTMRYVLLGCALAMGIIYSLFRFHFWRCPKCGAVLDRGNCIHCSECNWELGLK